MRLRDRRTEAKNGVSPVIEAAATDEKLRQHARRAAAATSDAYERLKRGRSGATDKRLPDDIGTAARELTEVARRLVKATPKRRRTGLRLPLIGLVLAASGYVAWKRLGSGSTTATLGGRPSDPYPVDESPEPGVTPTGEETIVSPGTVPGGPTAP